MNPIQAEAARQMMMAQAGQQAPQVVFLKTNPMAYDSYNGSKSSGGSFFLKAVALATAFIFRKNIANVTRKYFPELANGAGKLLTDAKGFIKRFKGSDYLATGWHKYTEYETAAKNFVKDGFTTPSGITFKNKLSDAWNWVKGLVMKKPPTTPAA